jgi:hypothetical protein
MSSWLFSPLNASWKSSPMVSSHTAGPTYAIRGICSISPLSSLGIDTAAVFFCIIKSPTWLNCLFCSFYSAVSTALSTMMKDGFDVKALRAFRVLRPLRLVSGVPSKCLLWSIFSDISTPGMERDKDVRACVCEGLFINRREVEGKWRTASE